MQKILVEGPLQSQLYNFLQETRPQDIKQDSKQLQLIVVGYLLPMMQEVESGVTQKKMIANWLEQILLKSNVVLDKIKESFDVQGDNVHQGTITWSNFLLKFVGIPSKYLNLIGQLGGSRQVDFASINIYTEKLYRKIIEYSLNLPRDEQMLLINKIIVLGYCEIVLNYLFDQNKESILLESIGQMSKQNKIVKQLYIKYIHSIKNGIESERIRIILKKLCNNNKKLLECFTSLLNANQTELFEGKLYHHYYELISDTEIKQQMVKQLIKWWAISRNYIITNTHSQIKTNILCLFIQNFPKSDFANSEYTPSIIEGIKKRLTDGSSKAYAMLVWKILAEVMGLPATEEVQKADYFVIKSDIIVNHQVKENKNIEKQAQKEKKNVVEEVHENQKNKQKEKPKIQQIQEENGIIKIVPKNLYDCILGLRNEQRAAAVLQRLPHLVRSHKQDLTLMWNSLLETLLTPLKQQYRPVLVTLFNLRPEDFVESVSVFFMNKDKSIGQKMQLMQMLDQGIEQLASSKPMEQAEEEGDFYFKKVKSTYFREQQNTNEKQKQAKDKEKQKDGRTRRWGHTRIDHQNKSKGVSLKIMNESFKNRFNPVSSLLYFKIIDIFTIDLVNHLRKHQIFVQQLLRLIATFTTHIKHHFDKNMLLSDITNVCLRILDELVSAKSKGSQQYEQSGGQTLMLCLQVLNKVSLVIDKYASQMVLANLKGCIDGVRKLPNYGMSGVVDMIQGSILKNVYSSSLPFEGLC